MTSCKSCYFRTNHLDTSSQGPGCDRDESIPPRVVPDEGVPDWCPIQIEHATRLQVSVDSIREAEDTVVMAALDAAVGRLIAVSAPKFVGQMPERTEIPVTPKALDEWGGRGNMEHENKGISLVRISKRCKNCKWVEMATGPQGLTCDSPKLLKGYNTKLTEPDGCHVEDDEGWAIRVGPEFGCVNWELP